MEDSIEESRILPPPIPAASVFALTPQQLSRSQGEHPGEEMEMLPGATTPPQASGSNLLQGGTAPRVINVLDVDSQPHRTEVTEPTGGDVTAPGSGLGTPMQPDGVTPTDFDMLQELMIDTPSPTGAGNNGSPTAQNAPVFFSEERVAVLRSRGPSFRRAGEVNGPDCWADHSEASSTDTRVSSFADGNYFNRAVQDLNLQVRPSEHTFQSLPLELLRHVCDSYISIKAHVSLRLVNRKLNVLVMSNCCFWQRRVPNYRDLDNEESKGCLLLKPRRTTVRDVSDVMIGLNTSRPSSRPGSRTTSPMETALSPARHGVGSFVHHVGHNQGSKSTIIYCFQGCAYQVWRLLVIEEKARKFRKSQRHELRAIAADTFASLLFPTAGSNAVSFFLSCTFFALLITEISLLFYSDPCCYTFREYLPYWLALVVALPLGAMYMYESSPQRRALAILTYVSVVMSSILVFLFKGGFLDFEVPMSLCLLPFFLMSAVSAVLESVTLVNRSHFIASKLVPIRDIFVNQKKRHVPMTPAQFLWLQVGFSISSLTFLLIGFLFFMLENDGVISKTDATFSQINVTNITMQGNVTIATNTTHTVGHWDGTMPIYASGLCWFVAWILSIGKVGCVVMAYYSKHLRKYNDCSFIVIGHGVLFLFLAVLSLLLSFPVNAAEEEMNPPRDADSLGMIDVLLASRSRRTAIYIATLATLIVYFIISFVNTLSSKEKYYKTSLRTKYLPYFDTSNDDGSAN